MIGPSGVHLQSNKAKVKMTVLETSLKVTLITCALEFDGGEAAMEV